MTTYAQQTSVSADRSRAEIEVVLRRYGATGFMYGWEGARVQVGFKAGGRMIRFELEMPDREDREFTHTPTKGRPRTPVQADKAWEQATRQRWRALLLVIKAKLEAVAAGISTFEEEFLPWVVLPGGATVGDHVLPMVEQAYLSGSVPRLMLTEGGIS
ncbi:MAG: hypothetical protein K0U98_14980 [Deltaproteobacteria bacterium]|nr:hypothetical protein [Deltaproteobacteria bacterium]